MTEDRFPDFRIEELPPGNTMPFSRLMAKAEHRPFRYDEPHIGVVLGAYLEPPIGTPARVRRWLTKTGMSLEIAGRFVDGRCILSINEVAYVIWPDQIAEIADALRHPREGISIFENRVTTVSLLLTKAHGRVVLALFGAGVQIVLPTGIAGALADALDRSAAEPCGSGDGSHRTTSFAARHMKAAR